MEYVLRFLIGGAIVSLFSVFGDVLRPKSVAGLLGTAPSVALATLGLAYWKHGPGYVATESLSMMIGAIALGIYSFAVCQLDAGKLLRAGRHGNLFCCVGRRSAWPRTRLDRLAHGRQSQILGPPPGLLV